MRHGHRRIHQDKLRRKTKQAIHLFLRERNTENYTNHIVFWSVRYRGCMMSSFAVEIPESTGRRLSAAQGERFWLKMAGTSALPLLLPFKSLLTVSAITR